MTKEQLDQITTDMAIYGNAFIHYSEKGPRRIDPKEFLKEAEEFSKLFLPALPTKEEE